MQHAAFLSRSRSKCETRKWDGPSTERHADTATMPSAEGVIAFVSASAEAYLLKIGAWLAA
jgi:hypothetical protein